MALYGKTVTVVSEKCSRFQISNCQYLEISGSLYRGVARNFKRGFPIGLSLICSKTFRRAWVLPGVLLATPLFETNVSDVSAILFIDYSCFMLVHSL